VSTVENCVAAVSRIGRKGVFGITEKARKNQAQVSLESLSSARFFVPFTERLVKSEKGKITSGKEKEYHRGVQRRETRKGKNVNEDYNA